MKISLPVFLTLIFLILRVANVIQWEWYWIICPLWIPIVVVLFVLLLMYIFVPSANLKVYKKW